MIPDYYDTHDAENLRAVYAVDGGRTITKNGIPFVYLAMCRESRESACAADYFAYSIVEALNLDFARTGEVIP